jgi:hypothetical protein
MPSTAPHDGSSGEGANSNGSRYALCVRKQAGCSWQAWLTTSASTMVISPCSGTLTIYKAYAVPITTAQSKALSVLGMTNKRQGQTDGPQTPCIFLTGERNDYEERAVRSKQKENEINGWGGSRFGIEADLPHRRPGYL